MWLVDNQTPYAAERTWVQDKDANKIWLVIVKATYNIRPNGSTYLASEQELPLRQGTYWGAPGSSSLIYDADLLGLKATTDILISGNAYAPMNKKASSLNVEVRVGDTQKRLRIFGDRNWDRGIFGITMSSPQLFESMPIRYERAFGGWDRTDADPDRHRMESRNPIGTGFSTGSSHCVGMRLPNIEDPHSLISSWQDRPPPAGFGPLECHWSPRRELAGTYDQKWLDERFPLWAENFDQRYNNCAPHDQQTPKFLRGGERVELINLTPQGKLIFDLPRVFPFFRTKFGQEQVEHRGQLCTVAIEPDVPRVIMSWQTSLICNHRVDELDATIVTEKRVI